ncbi:type VI secretion system Hcp family effector [Amorphus suaedae]
MQQNFFMTMKGSSKGDVTSKANTSDSDETHAVDAYKGKATVLWYKEEAQIERGTSGQVTGTPVYIPVEVAVLGGTALESSVRDLFDTGEQLSEVTIERYRLKKEGGKDNHYKHTYKNGVITGFKSMFGSTPEDLMTGTTPGMQREVQEILLIQFTFETADHEALKSSVQASVNKNQGS